MKTKLAALLALTLAFWSIAGPGTNSISPGTADNVEKGSLSFNFQGLPLAQMLDVYTTVTGNKVEIAKDVSPKARLTFVGGPLTKDQAAKLIEKCLLEQQQLRITHTNGVYLAHRVNPK